MPSSKGEPTDSKLREKVVEGQSQFHLSKPPPHKRILQIQNLHKELSSAHWPGVRRTLEAGHEVWDGEVAVWPTSSLPTTFLQDKLARDRQHHSKISKVAIWLASNIPRESHNPKDDRLSSDTDVKQQTNKDGSGKGQMAAWKVILHTMPY